MPTVKPTPANTSIQYAEYFSPAPVSVYLFSKGSGTTVTNHSTGAGLDLTPTTSQNWEVDGLDFVDDPNALIAGAGNSLGLSAVNGMTIQVKFRDRTYVKPSVMRLFGIHKGSASTLFGVDMIDGALRFGVNDGVWQKYQHIPTSPSATATVSYGTGTARCFIDGAFIDSFSYNHTAAFSLLNTFNAVVGAYDNNTSALDGVIEHLYILPRSVSDAEAIDMAGDPYRLTVGGSTPDPVIARRRLHHLNTMRGH